MNIKKEKNKKEGNKSLNPKGFWNEFENYIINKILDNIEIDKNIIQRTLEEIAFFEIKNGNYVFSERNLRESEKVNINQKILDICIKENIISQSGQWLHFISKDLQIYLAIYLEKINTNSRRDICITFIKEFEIETEINENFEPEGSSSCILDVARILEVEDINYTDFDIIFYNIKDKKIINLLKEKYMINNYYRININEALQDDETYETFEKVGICDFIIKMYNKVIEIA